MKRLILSLLMLSQSQQRLVSTCEWHRITIYAAGKTEPALNINVQNGTQDYAPELNPPLDVKISKVEYKCIDGETTKWGVK